MAWQGARLRPSRYSASGGSRRPQRKIEHRSLPPASIAASDSVRTERKGERRPLAPRRSGMSPNASHRVRPGLSSAASLITTLLISFDQEVLNQHLNLVTPEYPVFESPCGSGWRAGMLGRDPKALRRGRELAWAHHAIAHARSDAHHAQRVRNALSRNALLDKLLDDALEELDELLGSDIGPHGAPPFGPHLWPD